MRDLKIRPGMDTPKAKLKNPAPKDADSLLKQHMDKRQREKEPESRDPVRYATDRVEKNMRRGAAGAADTSRRMIKHYQEQKRQGRNSASEKPYCGRNARNHEPCDTGRKKLARYAAITRCTKRSRKSDRTSAKLRRSKKRKCRPAGAWAAESHTGRKSRLSAEPCREKNSRAAHCTSTVRPWRYNDHSAERQFGGIGQGQSCPQERTGHDQGHAHHACSTN